MKPPKQEKSKNESLVKKIEQSITDFIFSDENIMDGKCTEFH